MSSKKNRVSAGAGRFFCHKTALEMSSQPLTTTIFEEIHTVESYANPVLTMAGARTRSKTSL